LKLSQLGEFGLIQRLARLLPVSAPLVGIGDDAAVLPKSSQNELLTIDSLVQDVDFSFDTATPEQIGRKALAVNLSDIAAMGGKPKSAVIGLVIPRHTALETVLSFYDGMILMAKKFGVNLSNGRILVDVHLSQEQLANILGKTRQSVSGLIRRWKELNWIEYHYGKIILCDMEGINSLLN